MSLPLLLAGPILRRVEPNLVSVWVALGREATVTVTLWEGRAKSGAPDPHFRSDVSTPALRVADQLHIGLVVLKIPDGSPKRLQPGTLYSYEVEIAEPDGRRHTLASLGLLASGESDNGGGSDWKRPHLALGYEDAFLPCFSLPPAQLDDLRIVYGSCRRTMHADPDAMAWIDDLLREGELFRDPLKRPHQLVLGGDQIYADDLWWLHLVLINRLANQLIGIRTDADPGYAPDGGRPLECIDVPRVERRAGGGANPTYGPHDAAALPVGLAQFPAGRRQAIVLRQAQMTTVDGESHLLSFGEFAAMYLMVWSNACWPKADGWPALDLLYSSPDFPPLRPALGALRIPVVNLDDGVVEKDKVEKEFKRGSKRLQDFVRPLPKVRRALANVPTYMIFDDHDATDDWNLNPIWYDRVYTNPLGRAIMRNALVSYALFQDWGNDPLRWENERDEPGEKRERQRLLTAVRSMFPEGADAAPKREVTDALDTLLGFNQRPRIKLDGGYDAIAPPFAWHFSVPGTKHLLVAIDNRTRRSFVSRQGPPGNVPAEGQAQQIPVSLPPGLELLIVVGPLQVLGPALLDELIAPAAFRIFDAKNYKGLNDIPDDDAKLTDEQLETLRELPVGTRDMAGTNPDAIEAWAFDPIALEALLRRLAAHRRVVLLSGDVHYSAANALSYWEKGREDPARIVQFTSSGFKNVMPWYITTVDRVLSLAQRMVRVGVGSERMGWNEKTEDAFALPEGRNLGDIPPALRAKLTRSPMLVPTFGWPEGTTVAADKLPDWSWRMNAVFDERPDVERPAAVRPIALKPSAERVRAVLADAVEPGAELAAYQTIAARHQDQFDRMRHSRQILFRANFGLVRFERVGDEPFVVHELYTALRNPDRPDDDEPLPAAFLIQRASLRGAAGELPPERSPFQPPAW